MKTRLVLALLLACAVPASADRAANRAKHHTFVVCRRAARQAFHTAKGACPKAPPHDVRHACIVAARTVKAAAIAVCHNPPTTTTSPTATTTTPGQTTTTTTCPETGCTAPPPVDVGCGLGVKKVTFTVPLEDRAHPELGNGSDLDNGWTGASHNFPVIGGSSLTYCLTSCDPASGDCQATGQTGDGTKNTAFFGAPLPLLAANVPVCVVNKFVDATLTGTYNPTTGANAGGIHLTSFVNLRTTFPEVCPQCVGPNAKQIGDKGKCSASAKNAGAACTINGEVTVASGVGLELLSSDCNPASDDNNPTALNIQLNLTTGDATPLVGPKPCPDSAGPQAQDDGCNGGACTATCTGSACAGTNAAGQCVDAKGGISQLCCANLTNNPCFPTKGGGSVTRTGTPGTNGQTLVNATTFCIAHTDSSLVNIVTGLPGPGALLLPAIVKVEP